MMWAVGLLIYIWENRTVTKKMLINHSASVTLGIQEDCLTRRWKLLKSDEMVVRFVRHDYINGVMTT